MIMMITTMHAQTGMSLTDAVGVALSENYSVEISNNTSAATQNLATRGQAGQLPTVSASGLFDYGNDDTRIQLTGSPTVMETTGAQSTLINASVDVAYTVFSGGANSKRYKKLKINADLSDVQNRIEIESILMQVISAYYNVLRAQDNLEALEENLALSSQRLTFTENQHEYSGGSRGNVLSAQIDLNKDSVSMVSALQALDEAKIAFNQVLNRDLGTDVLLNRDESIGMWEEDYEALKTAMMSQNWQMKASRMSVQASMLDYKNFEVGIYSTAQLNSNLWVQQIRCRREFFATQLQQWPGCCLVAENSYLFRWHKENRCEKCPSRHAEQGASGEADRVVFGGRFEKSIHGLSARKKHCGNGRKESGAEPGEF